MEILEIDREKYAGKNLPFDIRQMVITIFTLMSTVFRCGIYPLKHPLKNPLMMFC